MKATQAVEEAEEEAHYCVQLCIFDAECEC